MFAAAVLGARGKLPRNGFVGMRTSATLASDEAWTAAHRASAWSVAVAGVISVAAAAVAFGGHLDTGDQYTAATIAAIAVGIVVLIGGVQADAVARRHR